MIELQSFLRRSSSIAEKREASGVTDIPDALIDAVTGGIHFQDQDEYLDSEIDQCGYTDGSVPDYVDYTPPSMW